MVTAQYIVRSHQGTTTGTERSSVLGGRREEKTRSECVVVERSMPVRQPPRMTDHRESNDAWMVPRVDRQRMWTPSIQLQSPPSPSSLLSSNNIIYRLLKCLVIHLIKYLIWVEIRFSNLKKNQRVVKWWQLLRILKCWREKELHHCPQNMFVSVTAEVSEKISALQDMDIAFENSTMDETKCHPANGNKKLNMKRVEMLQSSLNYGKWLTLAYRKFQSDGKLDDEWARWLFIYIGISESYAQQLQELAEKFYKYPRLHYLPIAVSDIYEIRENIKDMLAIGDITDYWKHSAVPTHVMQAAAPEFAPVFPGHRSLKW